MALLTVQQIAITGLEETQVAAAAAGDTFLNNGRTFFHAINASGSDCELTFDSLTACNQGTDHDVVVDVTAAEERLVGPFPMDRFNTSAGIVTVTYESETSLTVAAVSM